jgi:hypothetical protein
MVSFQNRQIIYDLLQAVWTPTVKALILILQIANSMFFLFAEWLCQVSWPGWSNKVDRLNFEFAVTTYFFEESIVCLQPSLH